MNLDTTVIAVNSQEFLTTKERRAGRRPSKENISVEDIFAFGSYENVVQVEQNDKIAKALKAAANACSGKSPPSSPTKERRTPARTFSSDSHDDYHKAMYANH